jgi:hypothetical protein
MSLTSDKNDGYFTGRLLYIYFENISLNSSYNVNCFRQNSGRNENSHLKCNSFFSKFVLFLLNLETLSRTGHGIDDNIMRHMSFTYWITKATATHLECVMLIAFPLTQW